MYVTVCVYVYMYVFNSPNRTSPTSKREVGAGGPWWEMVLCRVWARNGEGKNWVKFFKENLKISIEYLKKQPMFFSKAGSPPWRMLGGSTLEDVGRMSLEDVGLRAGCHCLALVLTAREQRGFGRLQLEKERGSNFSRLRNEIFSWRWLESLGILIEFLLFIVAFNSKTEGCAVILMMLFATAQSKTTDFQTLEAFAFVEELLEQLVSVAVDVLRMSAVNSTVSSWTAASCGDQS